MLEELDWVIDRAVEHLGEERAARYLRKFYPWYVERLDLTPAERRALQAELQTAAEVSDARNLLGIGAVATAA